jgi:hypothetical protein
MPLATIDQVKAYFGEESDKSDILLTSLVGAASDVIENYCGRTFASTAYTNEVYDGTGTRTMTLRHFPIVSVTSILENGAALSSGLDATLAPDVIIRPDEGQLIRPWFFWLPYFGWYKITYTAGFATVPAGITQACLELTGIMLRDKEHPGIQQKTTGQQTTTYLKTLSQGAQRSLDGYSDLILGRST